MHKISIPAFAIKRGKAVYDFRDINPKTTAVLVIDLQNFFMLPGQPMANPHAVDIVPNVNKITGALRARGGLVIFTQHSFAPIETGSRLSRPHAASSDFMRNLHGQLLPGKFGFELYAGLDVAPTDVVLTKHRPSALHSYAQSGLHEVLDKAAIDTLVITGCVTNGCCETTAREAHSFNYRVIFPPDANATMTDEEHNAALLNVCIYFADVQTTDEIVANINAARRANAAE